MISVVIPAYKKTDMLVANLQHNLPYLEGVEIVIVNDDPSASIQKALQEMPVKLIENQENLGFAGAVHTGILHSANEFIMLLNTDVVLNDTSYTKARGSLEQDLNVFAVSFAQTEKDGSIVGKNKIFMHDNFLSHDKSDNLEAGPTGWAEGGSCMMRKSYYTIIGGFDRIYTPFYWEDIDLSYRARKAGYTVLFDPNILVEHHHESTIATYFKQARITQIAFAHQCICNWKNLDGSLLRKHILMLPLFLFTHLGSYNTLVGFARALTKLPAIMRKRAQQKQTYKFTDTDILTT